MSFNAIEESATLDITIVVGNSYNRTLAVTDDAGDAVALSGFSSVAKVVDTDTDEVLANFMDTALTDDGQIPLTMTVTESCKLGGLEEASWLLTIVSNTNPETDTTTWITGKAFIKKVGVKFSDGV